MTLLETSLLGRIVKLNLILKSSHYGYSRYLGVLECDLHDQLAQQSPLIVDDVGIVKRHRLMWLKINHM